MRKLFIVSTILFLFNPLNANADTEANEFYGPVSTEGEEMCMNIAKFASVTMRERQYGTPKYALEDLATESNTDWGIFNVFFSAILNDAYDQPLEPTKKRKEQVIYEYPAKYYLICMKTVSNFETERLNK